MKNEYDEELQANRNSTKFVKQKQNIDEQKMKYGVKEVKRNTEIRHWKKLDEIIIREINEPTRK